MSKICQCKKDAIKKICLLHRNNFLLNCKENGFWFWLIDNLQKAYESDCVCEKKEENYNGNKYITSPQSCRVCDSAEATTLVHGACLPCVRVLVHESVMKEKQSHSPCTCDSAFHINSTRTHRPDCIASNGTQKIQSPCEHKWEQMYWKEFIPDSVGSPYRTHLLPMWGCIEKCGLVTCVDPSRSAPSKNPNNK